MKTTKHNNKIDVTLELLIFPANTYKTAIYGHCLSHINIIFKLPKPLMIKA